MCNQWPLGYQCARPTSNYFSAGEVGVPIRIAIRVGDFQARISQFGKVCLLIHKENAKTIRNPKRTPGQEIRNGLPVSSQSDSRSAPSQLPVSSKSIPVLPVTGLGLGIQAMVE